MMGLRDQRRGDYPYGIEIATRWMDCDAYGHVNNVIYYSWFDTAATRMMFDRGVLWMHDCPSIGLCVESHCEFFAPVEFPESVEARVRIGRMGGKSLRYEIAIFLKDREEPAAAGHFIHVFVDRESRRPLMLSDAQKSRIADLVAVTPE